MQRQFNEVVRSNLFWLSSTCVQGISLRAERDFDRYFGNFRKCAELLRRCVRASGPLQADSGGRTRLLDHRLYQEALIIGEVFREIWPTETEKELNVLEHLATLLESLSRGNALPEDGYRELVLFMTTLYQRCASESRPLCGVPLRGTPDEIVDD